MKRSSSSDFAPDSKRFEAYPQQSQYQQQKQLQEYQQQQIQAHQQFQVQQQQQLQMQQQIQEFQQQQQQQFAASQQFFNQPAFYPINSVNFTPFASPQASLMYNNSPSWNFMSTPPPFYTPPHAPAPAPAPALAPAPVPKPGQPPLPPPEMRPEKPPLPKEPEPGKNVFKTETGVGDNAAGPRAQLPAGSPRTPGPLGLRMRNLNGVNGGLFNNFNGGVRGLVGGRPSVLAPNGNGIMHAMNVNPPPIRGRRRNPHFFPQMQSPLVRPTMDFQRLGEFSDFASLLEEDQPAGPEKLTIFLNNSEAGRVHVNKKAKRKPMSTRYTRTKLWVREEAEAAIALEQEFNRMQKRPMLILKFPDPDLNKYLVKKYSPFIDTVHFQQPSTPRYCFVQLKEGADAEKVMNTINQIPFGTGTITAELKNQHLDDQALTPEEIDPYTLYIGNLPTHISVRVVKQYFPNAQRIDIGYAQRMRYTRYAFIRYNTVAEAMASYKRTVNALLDSRSLIVRFRRQKGNIGLPGETKLNAPRREGREVLPEQEPIPLEGQDDDLQEDELSEQNEEDADDEEDELVEADTANTDLNKEVSENVRTPGERSIDMVDKTTTEDVVIATKDLPEPAKKSVGLATDTPKQLSEDMDSKDNILEQANELMKKNNEIILRQRAISPPVAVELYPDPMPPRPGHVEGDIKLEKSDEEDSSDDGGINLLGTRVKDEPVENPLRPPSPTLEDIYLDDYEYDDLDCEPEEEDDEWATSSDFTPNPVSGRDLDEARRNELNVRENKPDLDQLNSLCSLMPSVSVPPIAANLEPKSEFDKIFGGSIENKSKNTFTDKDDLRDMFAQLNSDPECDDEDALFG